MTIVPYIGPASATNSFVTEYGAADQKSSGDSCTRVDQLLISSQSGVHVPPKDLWLAAPYEEYNMTTLWHGPRRQISARRITKILPKIYLRGPYLSQRISNS